MADSLTGPIIGHPSATMSVAQLTHVTYGRFTKHGARIRAGLIVAVNCCPMATLQCFSKACSTRLDEPSRLTIYERSAGGPRCCPGDQMMAMRRTSR